MPPLISHINAINSLRSDLTTVVDKLADLNKESNRLKDTIAEHRVALAQRLRAVPDGALVQLDGDFYMVRYMTCAGPMAHKELIPITPLNIDSL